MRSVPLIKLGRCVVGGLAIGAILVTGCARSDVKAAAGDSSAARTPSGFTITPAQRARIHVIEVALSVFRPVVSTTGTVAFNGDHSTQVLAPVSGPVSRILVPLGAQVARGSGLATVSSPDFATAVSAFRKAES
jgi:cobalt-zinc-cadmium efflux system membrane fusion protein